MTPIKSSGGAVFVDRERMGIDGYRPSVKTKDSIDSTPLTVVQHPDGDISIYIGEVIAGTAECVLSKDQAREFFTQAMNLF